MTKFPLLILSILSFQVYQIECGQCWTEISTSTGKCNSMISPSMTMEECCGTSLGSQGINDGSMVPAYVDKDLSSGEIFKLKMFKGGIPCEPCRATCSTLKCGQGKICREGNGLKVPICVCDTTCSKKKRKLGQVCGSDGKTYKNMCRVTRKKCLKSGLPNLQIAHFGQCQGMKLQGPDACDRMDCPFPRTCLLDQKFRPHCVKCSIKCHHNLEQLERQVCGSDGKMYKSNCHLRQAACSNGRTISIQPMSSCNQTLSTFEILEE